MESENDYIVKDFSSRQGGESSGQMGEERVANGNFHNPILHSDTPESALRKVQTSSSVTISSELFEKLYLQPHMRGSTHPLQKILGNPTPLSVFARLQTNASILNLPQSHHRLRDESHANHHGSHGVAGIWWSRRFR